MSVEVCGAGCIHPECLGVPGIQLPQPTSPAPATLCFLPWALLLSPRPGATRPLGVKMCPVACFAARALGLVTPGQAGPQSAPCRHSLTRQHPHIFGVLAEEVIFVKSLPSRDSHKSSQVETVSAAVPSLGGGHSREEFSREGLHWPLASNDFVALSAQAVLHSPV